MRGLKGKRVLVSGGSHDIGLATAGRFLEEQAAVVIGGVAADEVSAALHELEPRGMVDGVVCDVSEEREAKQLVDHAVDVLGGLDILANNAGVAWRGMAWHGASPSLPSQPKAGTECSRSTSAACSLSPKQPRTISSSRGVVR